MDENQVILQIPSDRILKEADEKKLIEAVISEFKSSGITDVKVDELYYMEELSETGLSTVVLVLSVIGHIINILKAVRDFLKSRKHNEILLETPTMKLKINGTMSDDTLVKLVQEARKTIENKKKK